MIYLRALLHRILGLPAPHLHEWSWGPMHSTTVRHHGQESEWDGDAFEVVYQIGTCSCGAKKTRRVW